jgi:hypothetical protein
MTLGGRPLYTSDADADAGGVTGQGLWWTVSPGGATVTGDPSSEPAPGRGY